MWALLSPFNSRLILHIAVLTKKGNFSHFCWLEAYILYETLIEKWLFWFEWGVNEVSTNNLCWDMRFTLFPHCAPFFGPKMGLASGIWAGTFFGKIVSSKDDKKMKITFVRIYSGSWPRMTGLYMDISIFYLPSGPQYPNQILCQIWISQTKMRF